MYLFLILLYNCKQDFQVMFLFLPGKKYNPLLDASRHDPREIIITWEFVTGPLTLLGAGGMYDAIDNSWEFYLLNFANGEANKTNFWNTLEHLYMLMLKFCDASQ